MVGLIAALSVLCVGDSITAWPDINYCDNSTHQTTNISANFTRSIDWAALDANTWEARGTFDVGTILLGTNDSIFLIEPALVKESILAIAVQMYTYNAPSIMISLEPYAFGEPGAARNPWLELYNPLIAELWDEHDWIHQGVDWRQLPGFDSPSCFLEGENGLHPTAACHLIARDYTDAAIVASVPEPGSVLLLGVGLTVLATWRRLNRA